MIAGATGEGVGIQVWDLIVVGGGPAGCAAAAAALRCNPGARVLLLDRHDFPRDKACGDGIAAEALDVLSQWGFDCDRLVTGYPPIVRLQLASPSGAVALRDMHRAVRVIPRAVLDARLVDQVTDMGAVLRRCTVRTLDQGTDAVTVNGTLSAPVVIGCDGAESLVRRAIGRPHAEPRARPRVALALRGYGPELPGQDGAQRITMSRANWPAYAWSFPLGDGRANVGYGELLTGRPLTRSAMLQGLRTLLPGVNPDPTSLLAHRLPLSPSRPAVTDGRVLLAGDALSLINPLTGEGIFYAVLSGALAGASSAAGAGAGAAYRASLAGRLRWHLRVTDAATRLTRAPRIIDAGVRAAARRQGAFDDLVRLGLGDGLLTPRLLLGVGRRAFR